MERNRNDDHNPKRQVLIEPGIDVHRAVVEILNNTLANEALLSSKNSQRPLERKRSRFP